MTPKKTTKPRGKTKAGNKRINEEGAGRPLVFTALAIQKLEEAFEIDASVGEACLHAGIGVSTYYEHLKVAPKLAERFKELRNSPVWLARNEVIKGLKNDPEFSLKYLERKRKKEFSPRIEQTGADGKDLNGWDALLKSTNTGILKPQSKETPDDSPGSDSESSS